MPRVVIPDTVKLLIVVNPRVVIPDTYNSLIEPMPPTTLIAVVAIDAKDALESPVILIS